jgi:hypothetical protein
MSQRREMFVEEPILLKVATRKRTQFDDPGPISGRTVKQSMFKVLKHGLLCLIGFIGGIGLLYDGLVIGDDQTFLPFRLTWWGYIIVGVFILGGMIGFLSLPFQLLRPIRVVLGQQFFQVQQMQGGRCVVLVQVPYRAIQRMEVFKDDSKGEWLSIKFNQCEDLDLFAKSDQPLTKLPDCEWNYKLDGHFALNMTSMRQLIEAHWSQSQFQSSRALLTTRR